jgi:hypothetical protein
VSAPTEEEIRASIAREWTGRIDSIFSDGFGECEGLLEGLYDIADLRPSEQDRLDQLVAAAVDPIRADARRRINEALVAAALAFAAEYPNAPRRTAHART